MSPATVYPGSSPQFVLPIVAAGEQDLELSYNFLQPTTPCKNAASLSSSVITSETLPVEVDSSALVFPSIPVTTCVSMSPHSSPSRSSQALVSSLSSSAKPFICDVPSPYLYPAGEDKFGRKIITMEDSRMHLDYYDAAEDNEAAEAAVTVTPDVENVCSLRAWPVKLPDGQDFTDKVLPPASSDICQNLQFPPAYFLDLHRKIRLGGTYNFAGARIPLQHSGFNVAKFRHLLKDYEDISVLQLIEFGFPISLAQDFELKPSTQNHSSSYEYFTYLDEFMKKEIASRGITGPLEAPPFPSTMVSPLMTADKKPGSKRPVFDGSFGDFSLNNNTPEKEYLGETCNFSFPTVLDLADLIIKLGPGCLLWKRDLSRWYMQIPVDPGDYDKLAVIWRGAWFVFLSYVWGCRHAGFNAQRISSAILHILRLISLGKHGEAYNALVYIDDFAGAEHGDRAWEAFRDLGLLLEDLGVLESKKKALPPSTRMLFLGVEFDSVRMCMQVGEAKMIEVKSTINMWYRRTVATKRELQSLQGQLMWVSKVVRFSRCFVTRIIAEQKSLQSQKQKKTLSHDLKKDLLWWKLFLDVFNGVELLVPETVACNILGDATLTGAGAWDEAAGIFWSRKFPREMQSADVPIHLKEFLTLIISVRIWGHRWAGLRIALHCDNSAVVQTINYQKPKDPLMQQCLREFLYQVTTHKFEPVMVRIPTNDNFIADFISRNHSEEDIMRKFAEHGVEEMICEAVPDNLFSFTADW